MYNPVLHWNQSPSASTTRYVVRWSRNGVSAGSPQNIPVGTGLAFWNQANPAIVLLAGDVVGATITAEDQTNSLASSPVTPSSITIPTTPPEPPTSVSLTLS